MEGARHTARECVNVRCVCVWNAFFWGEIIQKRAKIPLEMAELVVVLVVDPGHTSCAWCGVVCVCVGGEYVPMV